MCSHISDEIISRTLRAFSRAVVRQERTELEFWRSNVRKRMTFSLVAAAYALAKAAWSPDVITSGSHCCTGSPGKSRFRFKLTEMKRATFSARSTYRHIQ